jgi:hypothetical protein
VTFERSPQGQANRAIFYDVDWIVYTEGGSDENELVRSFDALFWGGVFRTVVTPLRFRAVPKGGKGQLIPLAEQVTQGRVDKVIVAMDRDYDDLFGTIIEHDRVIYTYGHSYENDVFLADQICEIADSLFPEICDLDQMRLEVSRWVSQLIADFRWAMKADIIAVHRAVKAFDREKPQKYLSSNAYGAEPILSVDRVRAEVTRIRAEGASIARPALGIIRTHARMIYGHLWEAFIFRAICCLHDRYSLSPKPTYEGLRAFAISQFQVMLLRNAGSDEVSKYYLEAVRRAVSD